MAPSLCIWKPQTSRAGEQQSFIESLVVQMVFPTPLMHRHSRDKVGTVIHTIIL